MSMGSKYRTAGSHFHVLLPSGLGSPRGLLEEADGMGACCLDNNVVRSSTPYAEGDHCVPFSLSAILKLSCYDSTTLIDAE